MPAGLSPTCSARVTMTRDEAHRLLGLSGGAPPAAIHAAFARKSKALGHQVATAPTPGLRDTYERMAARMHEARALLLEGAVAPIPEPVAPALAPLPPPRPVSVARPDEPATTELDDMVANPAAIDSESINQPPEPAPVLQLTFLPEPAPILERPSEGCAHEPVP